MRGGVMVAADSRGSPDLPTVSLTGMLINLS